MLLRVPGLGVKAVIVHYEQVGATRYFKAAGFPGRTAGLDAAGRPDRLDDAAADTATRR